MDVRILLFGPLARAAEKNAVVVPIPHDRPACTFLRGALADQEPALAPLLPACRFAINGDYVSDEQIVRTGDEVALIGMVCGG